MPVYARGLLTIGSILALLCTVPPPALADQPPKADANRLFARDNLIAWCIVPFDSRSRGPEDRAAMLQKLGFKHFAYDWRAKDIPTFDAEVEALQKHGVALDAFWVSPGVLNRESRLILDVLKRHGVKAQLWVLLDQGANRVEGLEQQRRVEAASASLKPLAEEAAKAGCSLALYNHGGWFGEPENQVAIIEFLQKQGVENVGMVYNLHHGHEHTHRLAAILKQAMPYLKAVNLNGMDPGADPGPRKILPLGQGELDLALLRTIRDSGYQGPIGILGHTNDDAEERLRDNLDGLDWLVPQLEGHAAGPRPQPRTPFAPRPAARAELAPGDPATVAALLEEARGKGDVRRGAEVFASTRFACLTCHRVAGRGGEVGPDLSIAGFCVKPEELVESVLWPKLKVKEGYEAVTVATVDGKVRQAYKLTETDKELVLRDPVSNEVTHLPKAQVEAIQVVGTLMPEGLAAAMTPVEKRDLIRFLLDLGKPGSSAPDALPRMAHAPADFAYDRAPLDPSRTPGWQLAVNRDRLYDFYAKEADFFAKKPEIPPLLPPFPGLDGGKLGHWGNQNENTWADARWNETDLGNVLSGVFRGGGATVPKGVCVRLGENGEMSACFNPETLRYEAIWTGGFVKFGPKRHGFLDGLIMDGTPQPGPLGDKPTGPLTYQGFYRAGKRVVFAYKRDGVEMLDSPWVENGKFLRIVAPANQHPLRDLIQGGASNWPQVIETRGTLGTAGPYAIDTIEPPFENPWKALMFFGDHDFLADGSAMLCTMQGDVWHVTGLDATLEHVKWRRFASGLHQALGLVVAEGKVYVLGRDQITRLTDRDGDGEADFYECLSNAYTTSTAGHDFICGLQRDASGRFLTASGPQGVIRIAADGKSVETLATGFRNPDGIGLGPDGVITVPSSEGEWVPTSMIAEIRPGGHYGYPGPKGNTPPDLPLVFLPRGIDNSSGGQVFADSDRFGPLSKHWIHLSFGAGTWFLLLRDSVDGQPQGAVVPLPGEFASGVHRGRMNPKDGQLYVSGMSGWGSYTPKDGCFQRVRYTGEPVQVPIGFHAFENGVIVKFSSPIDRQIVRNPRSQWAQAWNYRYSSGYGSQELSPSHPGVPGHDPLAIRSSHAIGSDSLFLEIPDLQPVNQLHLRLNPNGSPLDLFATIHRLAAPFTDFPGYTPSPKTMAAHPILADMVALTVKPTPNPWADKIAGARSVRIEAGKNLTFSPRTFTVKRGEVIKLSFINPDVVPHNWALIQPGTLNKVGDLANKIIAEPDAAARRYIPRTPDVLAHTDIAEPQGQSVIYFRAPQVSGRYPYLCTFPGHWMVMNGEMVVE
jgi:putative heme-binding domain-containing protein